MSSKSFACSARPAAPWLAAVLMLTLAQPVRALETVEEIEDCVRGNRPKQTSIQEVTFTARDRGGAVRLSRAKVYWKRTEEDLSKVLVRVSEPPKSRGAGLLLIEKEDKTDRFLYLPAVRKVRRITKASSSGSLLGTDFTYSELESMQKLREERNSTRLEDGVVFDRPVWVVRSSPDDDSRYASIVSFVDQDTCVPLRVEYYEAGERLRKVLTADPEQISEESGLKIPRSLLMEDLIDETSTEVSVDEIEIDEPILDKVFSRKELAVGRR